MTYDKKRIGKRIASLRVDIGLSQKELAADVGVSNSAITRYETGQSVPSLETAYKLAVRLGCTLDRLSCRDLKE